MIASTHVQQEVLVLYIMSNGMINYNIDDCMASIDYHYYVHITEINTDNLKKGKKIFGLRAQTRDRERERERERER